MKMMEILNLWTRCMIVAGQGKNPIPAAYLITLAHAAQEYYTSNLYTSDAIYAIRNANTHPYTYDGKPVPQPGLEKIKSKYSLTTFKDGDMINSLAYSLHRDIQNKYIRPNGDIDYDNPKWIESKIMATGMWHAEKYLMPRSVMPLVAAQALAAMLQK